MNDGIRMIRHRGKFYIEYEKLRDYLNNHLSDKITTHINDKHKPETTTLNENRIAKLEKEIKLLKEESSKDTIIQPFRNERIAHLERDTLLLKEHLNLKIGLVEKK